MARTTINSLGVPAGTIVAADLTYPLTTFSSTGIDDNADATAITIDSSEKVGIGTTSPAALLHINGSGDAIRVTSTNSGAGGAQVDLLHFSASPADGDDHASINFGGYYSGSTSAYGSAIRSNWTDVSAREACLKFYTRDDTTFYNHMQLNHFGHLLVGREDNSSHSSRVKIVNGGGSGYEASLDFCYEGKDTVRARLNTDASGGAIEFHTFDSDGLQERMRLTSNGTVLVGKTAENNSSTGVRINEGGDASFCKSGARTIVSNRLTNSGDHIIFLRNNSTVGAIGDKDSDSIYIQQGDAGLRFVDSANAVFPCKELGVPRDNAVYLGQTSARFHTVYAGTGSINTSDRNEKQDIEAPTDAEKRVAVAAKGLLRKYRWKDAVAAKDNNSDSDEVARIHFGIVAQDLKAAFEAESLDAGRYGMFTYDSWKDEETGEQKSRMGIRYSELLAFIIAAI